MTRLQFLRYSKRVLLSLRDKVRIICELSDADVDVISAYTKYLLKNPLAFVFFFSMLEKLKNLEIYLICNCSFLFIKYCKRIFY